MLAVVDEPATRMVSMCTRFALLEPLARQVRSTIRINGADARCQITRPTPIQERALELVRQVPTLT